MNPEGGFVSKPIVLIAEELSPATLEALGYVCEDLDAEALEQAHALFAESGLPQKQAQRFVDLALAREERNRVDIVQRALKPREITFPQFKYMIPGTAVLLTGLFVLLGFAALAFLTTQLPGTKLGIAQDAGWLAGLVANHEFFHFGVGKRLVADACHRERLGVDPIFMFGRRVDHDGAIRHRAVQQFVGRLAGKLHAAKQDFVLRMGVGVSAQFAEKRGLVLWFDVNLRCGQIKAVEGERSHPQVRVTVDQAGQDGAALQVDDLGSGLLATQNFGVASCYIDAGAGNGERLDPGLLFVAGVDAAIGEKYVRREGAVEDQDQSTGS